jgi:phosphomevalonate kinase
MIEVSTSAPGKVIIAGEYAVLDGAPAICMAVDRRAHVTIAASGDEFHSVLAPGYSQTVGQFTAMAKSFTWLEGAADFPLVEAVWQEIAAAPAENVTIILDSNEFIDVATSEKIGIGSSAALTVALAAAIDRASNSQRSIHRVASAAHRRLQGGAGSGADVACSLAGGIVEYRMGDEPDRALKWPDGLYFALLWSGIAASTGEKLKQLADAPPAKSRQELAAVAEQVAIAWRGARVPDIVDSLRAFTATLRRFDIDHALGVFDAGHAQLADAAESSGIVYKPCGAGGGDLGIAIASDAAALALFVAAAREHGFKHLPMAIESAGLRREGERH